MKRVLGLSVIAAVVSWAWLGIAPVASAQVFDNQNFEWCSGFEPVGWFYVDARPYFGNCHVGEEVAKGWVITETASGCSESNKLNSSFGVWRANPADGNGTYSLKLVDTWTTARLAVASDWVKCREGDIIDAQARVNLIPRAGAARVSFGVQFLVGHGGTIVDVLTTTTSSGWSSPQVSAVAPWGAAYARLIVKTDAAAAETVWFEPTSVVRFAANGTFSQGADGVVPRYWSEIGSGAARQINGKMRLSSQNDWSDLSGGRAHNCGLTVGAELRCWGDNDYGQATAPTGATFVKVSSGDEHACGLRNDGTIACWGLDSIGQATPPSGVSFVQIEAGKFATCGIRTDGAAVCWGELHYAPAGVVFSQLTVGRLHACGLKTDGTVVCWGDDTLGQASPPAGIAFTQLSAGEAHTCGLKADGAVMCWGDNSSGKSSPPSGVVFKSVTAGQAHTCGLKTDNTAVCWGFNGYGELTPPVGATFAKLAAESYYTCGLKPNGSAVCWGKNTEGQSAPPPDAWGAESRAIAVTQAYVVRAEADGWADDPAGSTAASIQIRFYDAAQQLVGTSGWVAFPAGNPGHVSVEANAPIGAASAAVRIGYMPGARAWDPNILVDNVRLSEISSWPNQSNPTVTCGPLFSQGQGIASDGCASLIDCRSYPSYGPCGDALDCERIYTETCIDGNTCALACTGENATCSYCFTDADCYGWWYCWAGLCHEPPT